MPITNPNNLCVNCMREKENSGVCPYCGFDESQYEPSPHHLPPRSILGGKCLIGRVLGEGGFGITYLGWDLNLDLKLAIKEYYPTGYVTRTNTTTSTVTPYRGEKTEFFTTGRSRFINEAKTLAKYYTLPGIVSVRDFFLENGTAYIVMEFVEGETLKQRLARVGGKMEAQEIFDLVRPLLRSLSEMHASGLIHRDISPDNIMITPENNIKLIDFGAARDYLDSGNKSLSVMLKPGFAPEEQYFARGQQGPWTDIYALCATIYRAITGVTPPESVERLRKDELKTPASLGARITPAQETALLRGLAVAQEDRWQSVPELYAALYEAGAPSVTNSSNPFPVVKTADRKAEQSPITPSDDVVRRRISLLDRWNAFISSFSSPKKMIPVGIAALLLLTLFIILLVPNGTDQAKHTADLSTDSLPVMKNPGSIKDSNLQSTTLEEETQTMISGDSENTGLEEEPSDRIFPLRMPERIPASEQYDRFLTALDLINNDELPYAMQSYDFSQRLSASMISSAVLDSEDQPVFSYNDKDSIEYYESIGSGVSISQGMVSILHEDGTVTYAYDYDNSLVNWSNIVAISSSDFFMIGLKEDGTAVTFQDYDVVQGLDEVKNWSNLVAISAGSTHAIGLCEDGTVVATGENGYGECNVGDWTDIVRISGGDYYTAGLRSDGTVVTTKPEEYETDGWTNIIAIDATNGMLAGIDLYGNVHLAGYEFIIEEFSDVAQWSGIVATVKGNGFIVGLQYDGTIVASGNRDYMQYDLIIGKCFFPEINY